MGNRCCSLKRKENSSLRNLSDRELEELHETTNLPENQILMYYRQFLKSSPNGRMTYSQFDDQLKLIDGSTDRSEAIFEMIDKDHSGQISFYEYLQSIVMFSQQSQPEQQLGAVFDTYQALSRENSKKSSMNLDIKGMRRDNVKNMFKRMYPHLSDEHIEESCNRFMESDQNKNGYITKQEFIATCMKNPKLMEQLGYKDAIIKENKHENDD